MNYDLIGSDKLVKYIKLMNFEIYEVFLARIVIVYMLYENSQQYFQYYFQLPFRKDFIRSNHIFLKNKAS